MIPNRESLFGGNDREELEREREETDHVSPLATLLMKGMKIFSQIQKKRTRASMKANRPPGLVGIRRGMKCSPRIGRIVRKGLNIFRQIQK